MSLGQKLLFFDSWQIFILMGNFFQIYGSSLSLLSFVQDRVVSTDYLENLFLGVGCFMAWVSIIHYIKQYGKLGIFVHLIQVGFPRILIESITFVPVAFAFITIGMTFFGWSVRFSSVKMSVVTLYTMLLGDSIQNVIYDLKNNGLSTFLAIIYVISFCWTFMLAVHNLWISIIVDELKQIKLVMDQQQKFQKITKNQGYRLSQSDFYEVKRYREQYKLQQEIQG